MIFDLFFEFLLYGLNLFLKLLCDLIDEQLVVVLATELKQHRESSEDVGVKYVLV